MGFETEPTYARGFRFIQEEDMSNFLVDHGETSSKLIPLPFPLTRNTVVRETALNSIALF